MKTTTCRQMGGPCDSPIHGNTADEMIKNGMAHIMAMSAKNDVPHEKVKVMMDEMQKNPASGMDWYNKFKADFANLKDD